MLDSEMAGAEELILGRTLTFTGDPLASPVEGCVIFRERGGALVRDGKIAAVGEADALRERHPRARVEDHGRRLITAGFVDAHAHYPQTAIIASWGKRLIDWLSEYTFPEEARFSDPEHAAEAAARFFDLSLQNGTTTSCSYATSHPESAEAYFAEAQRRGLRSLCGKTCMDRNAPAGLLDSAKSAYDDSKRLLDKWNGSGRLCYVITPRFAPTSTPEQLEALGGLWDERPECLMQTHLSEQTDEIEWVRRLFPGESDYLAVYERFGLLGERAVFGHAIHLSERERAKLLETGAAVAHCPTSNTFIGSGLFDLAGMAESGQAVGLATDVGGGSSFSMLRTMAAAYEISQLRGRAIHPAALYWLATLGSARALRLDGKAGNLAEGFDADIIALDLESTPAIAQRAARAESIWDALFPTIMMGDDRAVHSVWSGGRRIKGPEGG